MGIINERRTSFMGSFLFIQLYVLIFPTTLPNVESVEIKFENVLSLIHTLYSVTIKEYVFIYNLKCVE